MIFFNPTYSCSFSLAGRRPCGSRHPSWSCSEARHRVGILYPWPASLAPFSDTCVHARAAPAAAESVSASPGQKFPQGEWWKQVRLLWFLRLMMNFGCSLTYIYIYIIITYIYICIYNTSDRRESWTSWLNTIETE